MIHFAHFQVQARKRGVWGGLVCVKGVFGVGLCVYDPIWAIVGKIQS